MRSILCLINQQQDLLVNLNAQHFPNLKYLILKYYFNQLNYFIILNLELEEIWIKLLKLFWNKNSRKYARENKNAEKFTPLHIRYSALVVSVFPSSAIVSTVSNGYAPHVMSA
jgi:hypothetical protein